MGPTGWCAHVYRKVEDGVHNRKLNENTTHLLTTGTFIHAGCFVSALLICDTVNQYWYLLSMLGALPVLCWFATRSILVPADVLLLLMLCLSAYEYDVTEDVFFLFLLPTGGMGYFFEHLILYVRNSVCVAPGGAGTRNFFPEKALYHCYKSPPGVFFT